MKRTRRKRQDGVKGQNRKRFRPPPISAPAPDGMTTNQEEEEMLQGGSGSLTQSAQTADVPGYQ